MIEITNLRKEFDDLVAVDNLTLTIPAGEIYGLIGPNGAGKTTTMRIACGLLEPTQGDVRVAGEDVVRDPDRARQHIGYLSDFFSVYEDLRVWEYLDYFAHAYKLPEPEIGHRVGEVIAQAGLEVKRDSLIHGLSRGMKQRLGIARAMIHSPKVLLLDEPASGLDPKARVELRKLLRSAREQGTTILISSHILTELDGFCTSIGIMEKGRLLRSGKLEDVMSAGAQSRAIRLQWLGDAVTQIQEVLACSTATSDVNLKANEGGFRFSGSEGELAQVLAQMVAGGIRVVSFREVKQTVEEMYMKLSSHEVM
jgi:ABC-2 type transport system ATP-binding protein